MSDTPMVILSDEDVRGLVRKMVAPETLKEALELTYQASMVGRWESFSAILNTLTRGLLVKNIASLNTEETGFNLSYENSVSETSGGDDVIFIELTDSFQIAGRVANLGNAIFKSDKFADLRASLAEQDPEATEMYPRIF